MRQGAIETVCSFLACKFRGARIEHQHDFDPKFSISYRGKNALLKVCGKFLDDTSEEEILLWFDVWGLRATLANEKKLGVFVTKAGLSTFEHHEHPTQ